MCGFTAFRKGIAQTHTMSYKIFDWLSGVNTATQVCPLCAFVLKNIQNFIDLDACKQLFVLNSYKSVIKKSEVKKKNHKSVIFLE